MVTTRKQVVRYSVAALIVVVVVIVAIIVVSLVKNTNSNSGSESTGSRVTESLKFIVVVSRHGNRGSNEDYISDPYPINDTGFWPYGVFGYTPYGRVQMYQLGVRVRALYNGFLNSTYNPDDLHASSTYMDRLLMSGEAFLAGLYPPKGWQLWDTSIPWQPTPIYSDSPDKTVNILTDCARFIEDYETMRAYYTETFAANITEQISIYNNLTGSNTSYADATTTLFHLWDKLISEDTEGYTIPEWTKVLYPEPLQRLIAQEYITSYAGTFSTARLLIGGLINEIVAVMKSVTNGTQRERKVQYYSGHDASIVALQFVIGIPRTSMIGMVKPGSAMIFELHQNSTSDPFTVQTLYIDGGTSDLTLLNITMAECGDPCVFDSLVNITLPYTGVDYGVECANTTSSFIQNRR